jgi:hypothetical protein
MLRSALLAPALAATTLAAAQVSSFDAASNLVTIPSVSVGVATYVNVTLRHQGNYVFALEGATYEANFGPGVATYDLASNLLTMPAVKVGAETYLDVKLLNTGNYVFALQAATLLAPAILDEVKSFFAAYDALWATAVPASGAQATSFSDACYLHAGRTKAYIVADIDADLDEYRASQAFQIGARRSNLQVLALRQSTNPDGSARREVDVSYDVSYADGSVARATKQTLISGSSAGTSGCAAPQVSSALRFFGDRRLVGIALQPRNQRDERYSIGTGAALNPAVQYRRDIRVRVTDPMANAKYVVVSGPGPSGSVGGQSVPFSLKMMSPFVMRAAPEFAGRPGNYVNWRDEDSFRYCGTSDNAVPVAAIADCVGAGATSDSWGFNTGSPNAQADASFAAQGWRAGGKYRVDVYDDDGWRTVNGHAGKTPIATYYETLEHLPYTFVEMAGSGASAQTNDRFARLDFGAMSAAAIRANVTSATPAPMSVSWNVQPALPDGRAFRLFSSSEFFQGVKAGTAAGQSWPRLRFSTDSYPGSTATSLAWPVQAKPADMNSKTYVEYTLTYSDRNDAIIRSLVSFQ